MSNVPIAITDQLVRQQERIAELEPALNASHCKNADLAESLARSLERIAELEVVLRHIRDMDSPGCEREPTLTLRSRADAALKGGAK